MKNALYDKCKTVYNETQLALLEKAIAFAKCVHDGQLRESGEPYFIHPEAVADMLFDIGMDAPTVIAGLLHDVVEDGKDITLAQITEMFGKEIAVMVDGVTKLTKSSQQAVINKKEQQAENLRKMFLAIASDARIVIIKLVDRLHNMRTLEYCTTAKRARKAKETLEIYAPLAHRFGMGAIKCELEDLSFMHLMPEEYDKLLAAVGPQQQERMELLQNAMKIIREQLDKSGVKAEINGRPKHLYSIYRKMVKQNRPLDEIFDLIAVRIIVDTVNDCYGVLGIIHSIWKPIPGRFKDYISMPKPNMYRSLHTTLFGDNGIPFEVQIRTHEMHRTAEYGIAAHWMYKEGRTVQDELDSKMSWLRQALEYDNDAENAMEFIDNVTKDFLSEYVFVLTPRGEIIDLPMGSTPLDFAYRIHTNVGHHCQHARVNGAMARLDYKLRTNDVVEIVTSTNQSGPSRDWLNIVKTQQAKVKIRQWFKKANREENIQKGKEMLEASAKRQGWQLTQLIKSEYYAPILKKNNMTGLEQIYAAIGYGGLSTSQVLHKLVEMYRRESKTVAAAEKVQQQLEQKQPDKWKATSYAHSRGVVVEGDPNMVIHFAHCCNPLPGDEIVGYITRGRGISVHRSDCVNVSNLKNDSERIIAVDWMNDVKASYMASIHVVADDKPGVLVDVSQVMADLNISMRTINAKANRDGVAFIQLSFMVNDTAQLNTVIRNLKKTKSVKEVYRVNT